MADAASYGAALACKAAVSGVTITGSTVAGIAVDSSANGVSTELGISGVTVTGGLVGILATGSGSKITPASFGASVFAGQTGSYIVAANGALAGLEVDATLATFDGKAGSAMSLAELLAVEDKIQHKMDDATLGFVRVKATNVYVTTASGSIQRGIDTATAGDTVNVGAGTYTATNSVTKSVYLRGPNAGISPRTGTRVPEAVLAETGAGPAFTLPYYSTDNVTIEGFMFETTPIECYWQESQITFAKNIVTAIEGTERGVFVSASDGNKVGALGNTVTVHDNKFTQINSSGSIGTAVQLMMNCPGNTAVVTDNEIDTTTYAGILIEGKITTGPNGAPTVATVTGNTIKNTVVQGIQLAGFVRSGTVSQNEVTNANTSHAADKGGIRLYGSGFSGPVNVASNIVSGSYNGIAIKDSENITGKEIVITDNNVAGNSNAGIYHGGTGTLKAENNWFGSATGPANATNPGGTGAAVVGAVDFSPWLGTGAEDPVTGGAIGFQPTLTPVYYLPASLVFTQQPGGAALGAALNPQPIVTVYDEIGQIAAQFVGTVTLTLEDKPGSGTLGGTAAKNAAAGVVTFTDLSIGTDGGAGYTLLATASPLSVESTGFDIANPAPTLSAMDPIFKPVNSGAFTLTVTGSSFVPSTKVLWNGAERVTTYVSGTQLTAAILATDLQSAGTALVTVQSPTTAASSALTFTITATALAPEVWVDDDWTGPANCGVGHVWGYDAFKTIQSAINGVAGSGTVHVNAGTYTEVASAISKEIDIIGETAPDGSPLAVIVGCIAIDHPGSDTGWRIENLRFCAGGAGASSAQLSLKNVNRAAVSNCVFDGAGRFAGSPAVNGLAFETAPNGNTFPTVTGCVFSNGLYSAITGIASDLTVSNCVIDNVKSGMNMRGSRMSVLDSEIAVKAVTTTDTYGIRYGTSDAGSANGLNVQGCVISVNQNGFVPVAGEYHCAIYLRKGAIGVQKVSNCALAGDIVNLSATGITLDASGNWWGSADAAAVQTAANGGMRVDYSPWLTSGTDTAGDARGFKGNFATLNVDAASPKAGTVGYIQEGVNLATAGGTVNVLSGTYAEHVAIDKAVSVLGADKATTFIDGSGEGVVVLLSTNNVTLKGFTVRNSGDDLNQHAGIAAVGTTVALTGLVIEDNIVTNNATGVALLGASAVVQNNAIVDNARYGIVMSSSPYNAALLSTGNTVSGNTLRGNARDGIYCDAACGGNQIVGNWIGGTTGTIEGGEAEPEGNGVYLWFSSGNVVRFNEIVGNAVYGIELMMSDGNTITNNVVTNNSAGTCVRYGNSEQPFASNAVHFNDVSGNTAFGIALNFTADFQKNKADYALNAENNWFGHLTGPAHLSNPGGTGKAVADYVDFSPWLGDGTEDPVTGAAIGFQPVLTPVYYLPAGIKFSTEPTGALLGAAFGTQPAVTMTNEIGGIATQFNGSIALAIGNDPNPGKPVAGELTGTATLMVANGVAAFDGLSIVKGTGNGYTLVASTLGLPAVTSAAFDIANSRPVLTAIADWSTDEQSAPSTFTAQATDTAADRVAQTLTFSLVCTSQASMPEGITFDTATGAFSWQTVESQGGKEYTFVLTVTDNGTGQLSASDTFKVTVNEVNVAPVLASIGGKSVNEQEFLTFTATATDQDLPVQTKTFSLADGLAGAVPTGAAIDPNTGEFTWTPTESQGNATYTFDVVVTDNGANAANLTDTETITVTVAEVNVAPVLGNILPQSVNFGQTLTFTATATDQDLVPTQTLTFSMTGAPEGAAIDPVTGVFTWTPTEEQAKLNYSFTVTVTDNGVNAANLFDSQIVTIGAVSASHSCPGYWSPSTNMVVSNTFAFAGTPTGLTWTPVLPNANWIITAANAGDNGVATVSNGTAVVFTMLPTTSPAIFTYTVSVPGDQVVSNSLGAVVSFSGLTAQVAPIAIYRYHSADYRRDLAGTYAGQYRKIDSTEINRVLAYWRYGYKPDAAGLDGFVTTSGYTGMETVHHSADMDKNWRISTPELMKVQGYWRGNGYHVDLTQPDGYANDRAGSGPSMLSFFAIPTATQTGPAGYNPGATVLVTCTLDPAGATLLALGWKPTLPDGWVIESVSGDGVPELANGEIVCLGANLPVAPVKLVYTVRVPLTETRTVTLGGEALMIASGQNDIESIAMETLTLAPADSDNDGMADAWEQAYAGSAGSLDPDADLDGDLRSNFEEYLCGTVPTDAQSVLKMVALQALPDGKTQISWTSVAGHVYSVQRADGSPVSFTTIMSGITADPTGRNVYVDDVDGTQARFYRVVLQQD